MDNGLILFIVPIYENRMNIKKYVVLQYPIIYSNKIQLVYVFPLFFAKRKNLNLDIYFRWEYNLRQKPFIKITICET